MRVRYFWLMCFALALSSCGETAPQNQNAGEQTRVSMLRKTPANAGKQTGLSMLSKFPKIDAYLYRCGEMVQVVNYLRGLGKEKSLAALREYCGSAQGDHIIPIICRLLFVNPKGWSPPRIGAPVPRVNKDAAKRFPLFPIALSENVPFLVIKGYRLGGLPESGARCLELCEGFSMIQEDYPLTGYENAAKALTQNESFRELFYDKEDLQQMVKMIFLQASEPK